MSRLFPFITASLTAVLLACLPFAAPAADVDVIARGNGFEVHQRELDDAFINLKGTLAAQGRDLPETARAATERQLTEKLVLTRILLKKATDADRARAKEKVEKLIADEKARAKSEARFLAQIRAAGLTPEGFASQLHERGICEEVLDRELRPELGVTPEKVRLFYDQNANEFRQPERVRLLQVVFTLRSPGGGELGDAGKIEKKSIAQQIVERARKGEDFAELARTYSDDPPGRERGGEYVFPVGRMVQEFEAAVRGLATNQVSDVVVTPYSYHVVKLLERLPGETTPFDSVTNTIRLRLELDATQAKIPEYQKRLFQEWKVEIVKPARG